MDQEFVYIGPRKIAIWPKNQPVTPVSKSIMTTRFNDTDQYHEALISKILTVEQDLRGSSPPNTRCLGGQKIHKAVHEKWDCPELDLLEARALTFFKRTLKAKEAHIDGFWMNIYRQWESIGPHCHRRAMASMVYCVDNGDEDPDCPLSGRFSFVDPRIEDCCRFEAGHMTHPLMPEMTAGTMLIFPGYLLHAVAAYAGTRPRITIAWNINDRVLPGSLGDAFAPQAPESPEAPEAQGA